MSSEKNFIKISEEDLKKHLSEDEYADYLDSKKVEKLEEATPEIKPRLFKFCKICLA